MWYEGASWLSYQCDVSYSSKLGRIKAFQASKSIGRGSISILNAVIGLRIVLGVLSSIQRCMTKSYVVAT